MVVKDSLSYHVSNQMPELTYLVGLMSLDLIIFVIISYASCQNLVPVN